MQVQAVSQTLFVNTAKVTQRTSSTPGVSSFRAVSSNIGETTRFSGGKSTALTLMGLLGLVLSFGRFVQTTSTPQYQFGRQTEAISQQVNKTLYEESVTPLPERPARHQTSIDTYCNALREVSTSALSGSGQTELSTWLYSLPFNESEKTFCKSLVEELQANGRFYVDENKGIRAVGKIMMPYDDPDTYHYQSPHYSNYRLDRLFMRYADEVFYPRLVERYGSQKEAESVIKTISQETFQFFREQQSVEGEAALLMLTMFASFAVLVGVGLYATAENR